LSQRLDFIFKVLPATPLREEGRPKARRILARRLVLRRRWRLLWRRFWRGRLRVGRIFDGIKRSHDGFAVHG
jgi:hypothetical protein